MSEIKYLYSNKTKHAIIELYKNYSFIGKTNKTIRTKGVVNYDGKEPHKYFFKYKNKEAEDLFGSPALWVDTITRTITNKDKHIKKHYKNPFASVNIHVDKHEIYTKDNKLFISKFNMTKERNFNHKYFVKRYIKTTVSIHLDTGNFFIRKERKHGGGKKTNLRQNNFRFLYKVLEEIFSYSNKNKEINIEMFEILKSYFKFDFDDYKTFTNSYIDYFINKRKIKVPNEYKWLMIQHYPGEKFINKNDRKLVSAITDKLGMKSKYTNKIINVHSNNIDISSLVKFKILFGNDFYKYLSEVDVKHFIIKSEEYRSRQYINFDLVNKDLNITKKEKQALLSFINDYLKRKSGIFSNLYTLIEDHFGMMYKLREYFPDLKFTTTNSETFQEEHTKLARLLRKIRKETTIEYVFLPDTINTIEEDIIAFKNKNEDETIILKPVILKNEEEYNDEGDFMHHCVGSYINRDNSIIVSLRTVDGKDRVTNEYKIQTGSCVQSRHFCNANPPEHFIHGLEILEKRIYNLSRKSLLKWTKKDIVPIKINGIELIKKVENVTPRNVGEIFQNHNNGLLYYDGDDINLF